MLQRRPNAAQPEPLAVSPASGGGLPALLPRIKRPNRHRSRSECRQQVPIDVGLRGFVHDPGRGHPIEQELGSIQPDPFRAHIDDPGHFFRDLEIGIQPNPHAIGRDRRHPAQFVEFAMGRLRHAGAIGPASQRLGVRFDHHFPGGTVDGDALSGGDHLRGTTQADDGRHAERTDENHRVVGRAADVTHQSAHLGPVELRRNGGRQLISHHDQGAVKCAHKINQRIRSGSEVPQQSSPHVCEVADPFAQPRIALPGKHVAQFTQGAVQRPVGIDALGADERLDPGGEQRVVEHQQLCGEDGRLRRPDRAGDARGDLLKLLSGLGLRGAQTLTFAVDP